MSKSISLLLADWSTELVDAIVKNNSYCVALFSAEKELIFSNQAFGSLVRDNPCSAFINPTFDEVLRMENTSKLIFEGFLTLGDYTSINHSIHAKIYRKKNKLLVVGGVDTSQLLQQNNTMHQLNKEVTNLQRDIIKKNNTLEHTLSKLSTANYELKKINADKSKLMQIIAHDLRGPISSISGLAEILLGGINDFEEMEIENLLTLIKSSSKNTIILLDNLLNWSKEQTGKLVFSPKKITISKLIEEVLGILNADAKLKAIQINHNQYDDFEVYADHNMLMAVFRNLISNAIKFTKPGGNISISVISKQNQARVTVSDDGVGMNEETLKKVLDPSEYITSLGTANEQGSGLGLILCKEFVEKNNGKIWVESELGKGSEFNFTVPLGKDS